MEGVINLVDVRDLVRVSPGRDGTETIMRFDGIHTDSDAKAVLAGMALE
jgi:hypothetical protein